MYVCVYRGMSTGVGVRRECQTREPFGMDAGMKLTSSAMAVNPLNHETISPDLAFIFSFYFRS